MLPQNFFVIQSMTRSSKLRGSVYRVFAYYCGASQIEYFVRMSLVSVFLGAYLLPAGGRGTIPLFIFCANFRLGFDGTGAILPLFLWFIEYYFKKFRWLLNSWLECCLKCLLKVGMLQGLTFFSLKYYFYQERNKTFEGT
jgi:hypothetical protein